MQYNSSNLSIAALLLQEDHLNDFNPWENEEQKPAIDFLASSITVIHKHSRIDTIREQRNNVKGYR